MLLMLPLLLLLILCGPMVAASKALYIIKHMAKLQ